MNIEEKIQSVLIGTAAITALVPAARISVATDAQLIARPYIRHIPIGSIPEYIYSGISAMRRWQYQVSVFADSYTSMRTVANLVRSALQELATTDGVQAFWINDGPYQFEEDVRVHHLPLEFEVVESL